MIDYLLWEGRMSRKPYIFLSLVIFILFLIFNPEDGTISPILGYLSLIIVYLKLSWTAQRLHDLDLSGFWTLILIPVTIATHGGPIIAFVGWTLNFIFWACLAFMKGTDGENEFGPDPLAPATAVTSEETISE